MKYFVLAAFALFTVKLSAQDTAKRDSVVQFVEELPQFPGGELALVEYLKSNVKYPKKEKRKQIEGTAYVSFIIDKSGAVRDVEIFKGTEAKATKAMRKEAVRVVAQMPNWKPGTQRGKPVHVKYSIPIMFRFK
ncbi:MAG: energy transducer TonB [Bacteroidia bacterium]